MTAQCYRRNAAECLSAAERFEPPYRGLTSTIAEAWLSLARQQGGHGRTSGDLQQGHIRHVDRIKPALFYPLDVHQSPLAASARAGGYVAIPVGCDAVFE
jgi:hypothetical protein